MEQLLSFFAMPEMPETVLHTNNLMDLFFRFGLNFLVTVVIVHFVYFKTTGKRSYVFTYVMISTTVFFLCFLLGSIDLQLGFALGLFAIFGIIRYRTDPIPIREMTYLFLVITISVINSLARRDIAFPEIAFTNVIFILTTWLMERIWMKKHLARRTIIYDRVDLIHPNRHQQLKEDIKNRTGIDVVKFKIGQIDLAKSSLRLTVFYDENNVENILTDAELNDKVRE